MLLQANLYPRILAAMKPGATLGLSHGFLLGVLKNDGVDFRNDINVILVAPKVSLQQAHQCHVCSSVLGHARFHLLSLEHGPCMCARCTWYA